MVAIDPLAPLSMLMDAIEEWFIGGAAASIPAVRRAVASDPENLLMRWTLAYGLTIAGALEDAAGEVAIMRRAMLELPYGIQAHALLRVERGDRAGARVLLEDLDLTPFDAHLTFHFAEVWAVLGEHERALAVIELGMQKGFFPRRISARTVGSSSRCVRIRTSPHWSTKPSAAQPRCVSTWRRCSTWRPRPDLCHETLRGDRDRRDGRRSHDGVRGGRGIVRECKAGATSWRRKSQQGQTATGSVHHLRMLRGPQQPRVGRDQGEPQHLRRGREKPVGGIIVRKCESAAGDGDVARTVGDVRSGSGSAHSQMCVARSSFTS
jgi:hypothetical protein